MSRFAGSLACPKSPPAAASAGREITVASDADRFGALAPPAGASPSRVDAAEPVVYVGASTAYYEGRGLLQIVYTMLSPQARLSWRVTIAPDGEPLLYEARGADGCHLAVLTARAHARRRGDMAQPPFGDVVASRFAFDLQEGPP